MKMPSLHRFVSRQDGTASIETVIWFPVFFFVFGLMVDVAMIFHGQATVLRIVQDGNREYSVGRFETEAETATEIQTLLGELGIQATANTTEVAGVARTWVTVPVKQLQIIGYFTPFDDLSITVAAEHMIEYWES